MCTLLVGLWFNGQWLWIPAAVLMASIVDLFTRAWVASDRLGTATSVSILLKFSFAMVGFFAMVGQLICVGLVAYWIASAL